MFVATLADCPEQIEDRDSVLEMEPKAKEKIDRTVNCLNAHDLIIDSKVCWPFRLVESLNKKTAEQSF